MTSLTILGRRWVKLNNNTLHSFQILVDGIPITKSPPLSGGAQMYLQNAWNWFVENQKLNVEPTTNPWDWATQNNVNLYYTAINVPHKGDL